jgi:hypothetical protein
MSYPMHTETKYDYVVLFGEHFLSLIKRSYEIYIERNYSDVSYSMFKELLTQYTKDFGQLICDLRDINKNKSWYERMFYYKSNMLDPYVFNFNIHMCIAILNSNKSEPLVEQIIKHSELKSGFIYSDNKYYHNKYDNFIVHKDFVNVDLYKLYNKNNVQLMILDNVDFRHDCVSEMIMNSRQYNLFTIYINPQYIDARFYGNMDLIFVGNDQKHHRPIMELYYNIGFMYKNDTKFEDVITQHTGLNKYVTFETKTEKLMRYCIHSSESDCTFNSSLVDVNSNSLEDSSESDVCSSFSIEL